MKKFTRENDMFKEDFKTYVVRLIDVFCELLQKVDISFFSTSKVTQMQRPDQPE